MSLDHTWEKFFKALHGAVSCDRTLQKRIACVYEYDIARVDNEDGEIPAETWGRIEALRTALESNGNIAETAASMSDTEAAKWLHEVVEIFNQLAEIRYGARVAQ